MHDRNRILGSMLRGGHRYRRLRVVTSLASVLLLSAVPLSGLAQLDLWRGHHLVLSRPATATSALLALTLAGGGSYLVTFIVNLFGGRLFCGFGCPLSQVTRLDEGARLPRSPRRRMVNRIHGPVYSFLFASSLVLWLVDVRVFAEGSLPARLTAGSAVLALTLLVLAHGRFFHFAFCRNWCPVGLYYSVVAPTKSFGIRFQPEHCIECDACDKVCPLHIPPRELLQSMHRDEGLAISEAPAVNHCISCGDCVEACEMVMAKKSPTPAPIPLTFDWDPFRDQIRCNAK